MDNIIQFLSQKNYKIIQSTQQKSDEIQADSQYHRIHLGDQQFIGLNVITQEKINIQISKSDRTDYEMVKYEYQILSKMVGFNSVVKVIEHFDLSEEDIFILITEYNDNSVERLLSDVTNAKKILDIVEVIKISNSLIYSLFELHSKGIAHNHIRPSSAVIDSQGNIRFKDFISSSHLDFYYQQLKISNTNDLDLIYRADDFLRNREMYKEESETKKQFIAFSEDVYSLGVIILQLIGIEVNQPIIDDIITKEYQELSDLVTSPEYFNILAFVKSYLLFKNQEQRKTIFQTKRLFFKCHEKYIGKEQQNNHAQKIIDYYHQNEIPIDSYFIQLYITAILSKPNPKLAVQLIEYYYQLPQSEIRDKSYYLLQEISYFFYEQDQMNKSLDYQEQSLEIRKEFLGEDHQLISECLNAMGHNNYYKDNYNKALYYYELSYEIKKKLYGDNHISLSEYYSNIADCNRWMQKTDLAVEQNLKAIQIANDIFQGDHVFKLDSMITMGNIYRHQQKYQESLEQHLEVLRMRQNLYPPDHVVITISMRTVGIGYQRLNDFEKALEYHHKSLELKQKAYQGNHQHIAHSFYDLAECYGKKDAKDSEYYYRYKHYEMQITLDKRRFSNYHYNEIFNCIEKFNNPHLRLERYLRIFRISLKNLQGENTFLERLIIMITFILRSLEDYETEEEIELLRVSLKSYIQK